MLKKLDIYILGKFLSTFFFTVLIFTLISVFIDFSEKVEKFITEPITRREILLIYYPGFIVFIAKILWPLYTLIAVIFFTSRMASNSEILSVFNAGVSFRRLMRPYLVGAGVLMVIFLTGSHFFVPWISKLRLEVVHTHLDKNSDKGKTGNVHIFTAPGEKVFVQQFRKADSTARNFRLERFDSSGLVFLLQADQAQYQGGPPHRWKVKNFIIRTFNGEEEGIFMGRGMEADTTINLHPGDFIDYKEQQDMMTTPDLLRYNRQRTYFHCAGREGLRAAIPQSRQHRAQFQIGTLRQQRVGILASGRSGAVSGRAAAPLEGEKLHHPHFQRRGGGHFYGARHGGRYHHQPPPRRFY